MYLGTSRRSSRRASDSAGWRRPPVLEKLNLGKQGTDLCTSTLSQLMVQAYFERGNWRDYVGSLVDVYRRRRDTMLDALAEHFPPQAEWTRPPGACSSGPPCPTSSTPPTCLLAPCATTSPSCPARPPYLDGRGRSSMRLNFSASPGGRDPRGDPPHRRGGDRAGAALRHAHRRGRGARRRQAAANAAARRARATAPGLLR